MLLGRQVNEVEAQALALHVERVAGVADEHGVIAMIDDSRVGEITVFRHVDPEVDAECIAALVVADATAKKTLVVGRYEKSLTPVSRVEAGFLEYGVGQAGHCTR